MPTYRAIWNDVVIAQSDATMVEFRTCLECKSTRGVEVPRTWRLHEVTRGKGVFAARVYLHNLQAVDRRIAC